MDTMKKNVFRGGWLNSVQKISSVLMFFFSLLIFIYEINKTRGHLKKNNQLKFEFGIKKSTVAWTKNVSLLEKVSHAADSLINGCLNDIFWLIN